MLQNANFLCEIGTEEIPAGYMPPAIDAMKRLFSTGLTENRIDYSEVDVLATPRRIVVMASALADSQREEEVELKGPAAQAAFDKDGKPTKALQGFMKGNGLTEADISTRDTDKGSYVFGKKKLQARATEEILPEILKAAVNDLPFPKRMKWSDKAVTFPRPINYFLVLYNDRVVPLDIDGIPSSNLTRGHYIQHNKMIEVPAIARYEKLLSENGITLDQNARKAKIHRLLEEAAKKQGGIVIEDDELLNTVNFLVEDPHVVVCDFDTSFLDIPDVALIAEMKEHQKYFPIVNKDGKLLNSFLVVSNNPGNDNVVSGNRRVVTARFTDATFFFEEDRKQKLIDRVDALKNVLFHKELGSIYDKIMRMQDVAESIIKSLGVDKATAEKIKRAVLLSKTDLETAMVYEFSSLQGQMGNIYAQLDGEDPEVAAAIEEHYRPRFQGDELPASMVSAVVSLAEKLDNIFGSFSVGNIPKGSQDPYALRRQANAIVEMLLQKEINLDLEEVLKAVAKNYRDGEKLIDKIVEFVSTRAKTIFTDRGMNYDEIDACLSTRSSDFLELYRRAHSIHEFRKDAKFSEMLMGFKRMNNIVTAFRKENKDHKLSFSASLLKEDSEKSLFEFFDSKSGAIKDAIDKSKYIELFELIIEGKSIIDEFFDRVLVMDKDTKVRDNRLALLENTLKNFTGLLDFSKLSDK